MHQNLDAANYRLFAKLRRPVFFNLTQIQMPVGALTSITHRVTGMLLGIRHSILRLLS